MSKRFALSPSRAKISEYLMPSPPPHPLLFSKVDDLDFDPPGTRLVSVAGTSRVIVWRTVDGSKERELAWFLSQSLDAPPYVFRTCRFASVHGVVRLFTVVNPARSVQSSHAPFLVRCRMRSADSCIC